MKCKVTLIISAFAIAICLNQTAIAQVDGYRFGVGLGYAGKNGCDNLNGWNRGYYGLPIAPTPRIDQPPFFAVYPPVYYSQDIIARPYGVSPYAAPAGIVPVEMSGPFPVHQANPYYADPAAMPPSETPTPETKKPDASPKTTWIKNPFYDPLAAPGDAFVAN